MSLRFVRIRGRSLQQTQFAVCDNGDGHASQGYLTADGPDGVLVVDVRWWLALIGSPPTQFSAHDLQREHASTL